MYDKLAKEHEAYLNTSGTKLNALEANNEDLEKRIKASDTEKEQVQKKYLSEVEKNVMMIE